MNLLNIDINDAIPDIKEAYVKVYGEEYREVIENRMSNIIYLMYNTVEGISSYTRELRNLKTRQLVLEFLEQIGIDVSEEKLKKANEAFKPEIVEMIKEYIGGDIQIRPYFQIIAKNGILAWGIDGNKENGENIEEKVKFINFFRGKEKKTITKETFGEFSKTDEYGKILLKIKEYLAILRKIGKKYSDFEIELEPYDNYLNKEQERERKIEKSKTIELYQQIEIFIPEDVREYLENNFPDIEERVKRFLGDFLSYKFSIENFSKEDENMLQNYDDEDKFSAILIYDARIDFFRKLGFDIKYTILDYVIKKNQYEELISRDEIKRFIPPQKLVDMIKRA